MGDMIDEMARRIVDTVAPEAVILFGPRATGEGSSDSDVDLMVVESEPFGPGRSRRKEMTRLGKALVTFPVPKDILVRSREEFERWRDSTHHVVEQAWREGRRLDERP